MKEFLPGFWILLMFVGLCVPMATVLTYTVEQPGSGILCGMWGCAVGGLTGWIRTIANRIRP